MSTFENPHDWGYRKVNGWRYYDGKRSYPPTSPPYPREVVKTTIQALGRFEKDRVQPTPWLAEYSQEEVEQIKKKSKPLVLRYFKALQTFKTPDSTYQEAMQSAKDVFDGTISEIYENDPETFVNLILKAQMTTITDGLYRSNIKMSLKDYFLHPDRLENVPNSVRNVVKSSQRYLTWESVAPSYDRLAPYQNPFGHEHDLYSAGVCQMGFTTDENGNEVFEYDIKMNPDTGYDFANIAVPVARIEAEIARRKHIQVIK